MTTANYQFEFVSGCPGSSWSSIAHKVRQSLNDVYDISDQVEHRCFTIPDEFFINHTEVDPFSLTAKQKLTHHGSYFGPATEYGQRFDAIEKNYSVDSFTRECLRPFSDSAKPVKQIKSHWFAYNLDWLWNHFKGHHLLLFWKDPVIAHTHWHSIGGWDITYPNYDWYRNSENSIAQQIQIETDLILEFVNRKNLLLVDYDNDWFNKCYGEFDQASRIGNSSLGVKIARTVIS